MLWTRAPRPGHVSCKGPGTPGEAATAFGVRARAATDDLTVRCASEGLRPATTYRYRFVQGERASASGTFTTAPLPTAAARSGSRSPATPTRRPGQRQARLQPFRGLRAHGRASATTSTSTSATRSTRTARSAGARRRAHRRARSGRSTGSGSRSPALRQLRAVGGPLQPLGRPRVHQRLLARRARRRDLRRRREGVPRLRARRRTRPRPGSTARSAGAGTSSSSSSTSARSAARRRPPSAAATSRRPRRRPFATRSRRSPRRSRNPVPPACLAAIAGPVAHDARRPPVRRVHEGDQGVDGDVEGGRQRGADPAVLRAARTTAGRATRPSASGSCASSQAT